MQAMAIVETCRSASRITEESLPCQTEAVAARRRRMEIRRFKVMASSSAAAEQPVSKRSRPVYGISYISRKEGGATLAFCVTDGNCAVIDPSGSDEWKQENSASRLRVNKSVQAIEPGRDAFSHSSAWERHFGGEFVCNSSMENDSASTEESISNNSSITSSRSCCIGTETVDAASLTCSRDVSSSVLGVGGLDLAVTVASANFKGKNVVDRVILRSVEAGSDMEPTSLQHGECMTSVASDSSVGLQVKDDSNVGDSLFLVRSAETSSISSSCGWGNDCPPHGAVSLCGRRRDMEDAVAAVPRFMTIPYDLVGGCDCGEVRLNGATCALHFFGVYDGHGGAQAAKFCADHLHEALVEEVKLSLIGGNSDDSNHGQWEGQWQKAMSSCFLRMDAEVGGFIWRADQSCESDFSSKSSSEPIAPETVGSTATVAVIGSCHIIVANCGDSRAVLSRGGEAVPLSVDHKPDREDEMARVEAAGGRVIYWNGYRVLGVLAMSRAIGDRYLKPYVIAEPEVQCIKRTDEDECLILASDGLWDVMSNDVVCDIARRALNCRRLGNPATENSGSSCGEEETPAAQTAALLTKLALAKGSSDNISVVVVDLRAPKVR